MLSGYIVNVDITISRSVGFMATVTAAVYSVHCIL